MERAVARRSRNGAHPHKSASLSTSPGSGAEAHPAAAAPARRRYSARPVSSLRRAATSDVQQFVRRLTQSTPIEMVKIEREGVGGSFIKSLSRELEIPATRMFRILGIPK